MRLDTALCPAFNPDASETVAYNNPLFPAYARYGILSTYPDYSAVSHWHEDLEFIVVDKGRMTYNVNGKLIELSASDGIMVNSRQLHYGFSAEHHECEFLCILLSPSLLPKNEWFYENCIERITAHSALPYLYLKHDGWQGEILSDLRDIYRSCSGDMSQPSSCFPVLSSFLSIMGILYEHLPAEEAPSSKDSLDLAILKRMMAYVEDHYTEQIRLEDLTAVGSCCKSKCSWLFKRYLRDTPVTYITKYRLRKSLGSLLGTEKSITDIAGEYGFGGPSYYCETFKKYYQVSPYSYRKFILFIPYLL